MGGGEGVWKETGGTVTPVPQGWLCRVQSLWEVSEEEGMSLTLVPRVSLGGRGAGIPGQGPPKRRPWQQLGAGRGPGPGAKDLHSVCAPLPTMWRSQGSRRAPNLSLQHGAWPA